MTERPRKKSRRVYGRPLLNKTGKLTDEAIEEFGGDFVRELREVAGDREPLTGDDRGRINPNENPGPWEEPPEDWELLTYQELMAEVKREKKGRGKKS